MTLDQLAHDCEHPRYQIRLGNLPVGKSDIIGSVDQARIRPRPRDLPEYGETAKAGIEHENRRGRHRVSIIAADSKQCLWGAACLRHDANKPGSPTGFY
jgi:hypothetical protein